MCKSSVQQRFDLSKGLKHNWDTLVKTYGITTRIDIFVEFEAYFSTKFTTMDPLTTQINNLSQLRSWIVAARMEILDSFHSLTILHALPPSYTFLVQSLLSMTLDFSALTPDSIWSCIFSKKTQQGSNPLVAKVDTITKAKKEKKNKEKKKCNWCGILAYYKEKDCHRKVAGMAKGDQGLIPDNLKVNAVTTINESNDTICIINFYSSSDKSKMWWMLDSRCTDHITNDPNDFFDYMPLLRPSSVKLIDKAQTKIDYLG
jgi:hypothetical protein